MAWVCILFVALALARNHKSSHLRGDQRAILVQITYLYIHNKADPARCLLETAQLNSVPNSRCFATSSQTRRMISGGSNKTMAAGLQKSNEDKQAFKKENLLGHDVVNTARHTVIGQCD
jgi:hypothetical protein